MGFLDSVKKEAARAQLEADKLVRINRVQGQINTVKQQIRQRITQLGEKALELYRTEQLSELDLIALCDGIVALEQEIADKEAEIGAIRQETLPEGVVTTPATCGHLCPKCKISLPEEAVFCPNCGSIAVDISPPAATTTSAKCANCGASLAEESKFCAECGAKVEKEQAIAKLQEPTCPECQAPVQEGAVFCPNCGAELKKEQAVISDAAVVSQEETDTSFESATSGD